MMFELGQKSAYVRMNSNRLSYQSTLDTVSLGHTIHNPDSLLTLCAIATAYCSDE